MTPDELLGDLGVPQGPPRQRDPAETLVERFVDDRDSLSDEEWAQLVSALTVSPELAQQLQIELTLDEALSQQLAVDRKGFTAQVKQRLHDEETGMPGAIVSSDITSSDALAQEMRQMAGGEMVRTRSDTLRRRRWFWVQMAMAVTLVAAIAGGGWYWYAFHRPIAVVTTSIGQPSLTRDGKPVKVLPNVKVKAGDRISSLPGETLTLRYHDGTTIELYEDSSIELATTDSGGKQVNLRWGGIAGNVESQPPDAPMTLVTPHAVAEVRGTQFALLADEQETRLDVIEGLIDLRPETKDEPVEVKTNHHAIATVAKATVYPTHWPARREGLVFAFQSGDPLNEGKPSPEIKPLFHSLIPEGAARRNHDFALVLDGGGFRSPQGATAVLEACQASGAFTVEALIHPSQLKQKGPARIVSFSRSSHLRNFTLGQEADKLVFRLQPPEKGKDKDIVLGELEGEQPQHVVVSYRPGRLVCYLEGKSIFASDQYHEPLATWRAYPLIFGNEEEDPRPWHGVLEAVAIYDRFMHSDEARRNAQLVADRLASRQPVQQADVLATLKEVSQPPPIEGDNPAGSTMIVCRYTVDEVISGDMTTGELLVARWHTLNGQPCEAASAEPGRQHRLLLERYGVNAQLEGTPIGDDFGDPPWVDAPRYYDASTP